jgi:hypothetical protein
MSANVPWIRSIRGALVVFSFTFRNVQFAITAFEIRHCTACPPGIAVQSAVDRATPIAAA